MRKSAQGHSEETRGNACALIAAILLIIAAPAALAIDEATPCELAPTGKLRVRTGIEQDLSAFWTTGDASGKILMGATHSFDA